MQEDWHNYDFDITLNHDDVKYDIGIKIISKGTIYVDTEEEWLTDPPGYPPVSMGHYVTGSSVEEIPDWKIFWLDIYSNGEITEIQGQEEVNNYMTMNPDKKELIESYVDKYCEEDLAEDAADEGSSTFAYEVHVSDRSDDW